MILPASYLNGFAPRDGQPLYPSLWTGCVGAWNPGLGPSGLTLRDQSGFGRHGTLTNGPTFAASQGRYAMNFDGTNDYVDAGNMGTFPSAGSILFSINPAVVANYNNPLQTDDGNAGIRFEIDGYGTFYVIIAYSGSPDVHYYLSSGLVVNKWRHVTLNWNKNANSVAGYLDGVQKFSEAQTNWPTTLPKFRIGAGFNTSRFWNGLMDDVRLYNRALSPNEIRTLATRPGIAYEMAPRRRSSAQVTTNRRRRIIIGGNR